MRLLIALFLALAGLGHAPALLAQACTSAASGNWTTAGTWNAPCNVAGGPTAANTVTIQNNHTVTVTLAGGAVAANSITIAGGVNNSGLILLHDLAVTNAVTINAPTSNGITKQVSVGARTLTVGGDFTINGGTAGGTAATRTSQLTVTTGTVTIGTPALNRNLIINAGTATTNLAQVTLNGANGLITVNGNVTLTGGTAANTQDALLTVANASNAGRGYVITGNLNINSTIATSSAVTMTGAAGGRISVGGNVTNQDTMALAAGIFTASGTASTFAIGNNSAVALSHVSATTVTTGSLTIAGNTTVTGGVVNPSGATLSATTGVISIGTVGTPRNLSISAGSNTNTNATVSVTTGRITVSGTATLTGGAAAGRNALLTSSGIPAVAGNGINVGSDLNIVTSAAGGVATGTVSMTAAGVINVGGTVNNGGTVTIGTGAFNVTGAASAYNNSSAVVVANTTISTGTLNLSGNTPTLNNAAGETMSISTTGNITVGNLAAATGTLTNAGTLTLTAGGTVNANGPFTNSGTFTNTAAGQINLRGITSTFNGTFNRGTGTVTLNRLTPLATTQTLSGTALTAASGFNNLVVNNTTGFGVTLGSLVAVRGTLTLTDGTVTTGANSLVTVPSCATPSVLRTNGYVIGNLQKTIPAGASACTFEVGTAAGYIPIGTTFPAGTTTGNITASATGTEHPSHGVGPSGINTARSVNRYWTLASGPAPFITVPAAGFNAIFNFITPGDYDGGATDPAKFTVQRFSGGAWTSPAVNATCTPIAGPYLCNQVNGLSVAAGFGDFAVGEANYTGGNAGWFNVFESSTGAGAHLGNIFTKIVGTGFSLDVVAINALRNGVKPNYSTNPITVDLLDASDNSGALNAETDCRASWALVPGQSFSLSPAWASSRATVAIPAQTSALREGRIRVTQGTLVACSTNNFSIRPTGFTVSSTNATNNGTSGTPTFRAGSDNFNLTATAVAGYNGTPSIDNTAGMVIGTPTQGTIGGSFSAAPVGTGIASGSTFTYSEVGNVGLAANAVFDSSFTSVDTPGVDCIVGFSNVLAGGQYGCSIGSTAVAPPTGASGFGRFIPHNFNVTINSPTLGAGCGTFTYVGAPFSFSAAPVMTVTARNSSNATTTNYAGAYMKLSNTAGTSLNQAPYNTQAGRYTRFDALGGGTTPALDVAGLPATTADPTIGVFAGGVGTLTFSTVSPLGFTRSTTTPNAPFNADIALSLNVIDTDSVAFAGNPASLGTATSGNGIAFTGGKAMRFGRMRLLNASGSTNLTLTIPLENQYWTGTGFATNTLDGCTSLSAANLAFSAYAGGISGANMNAANISLGGAFVAGVGNLKLTKPNPAATSPGSTTLTINLAAETKTYLQGNWGTATYTANPSARAAFGSYSSQPRKFIFYREVY